MPNTPTIFDAADAFAVNNSFKSRLVPFAMIARAFLSRLETVILHAIDGVLAYYLGTGGAVTQLTDATTAVTLNTACGQITTFALTTAAGAEEIFTVNNSLVTAKDIPLLATTYAGAGTPAVTAKAVAAGSFQLVITNLHASAALNAALTINFGLLRIVIA